jgi:mannose-6-phosphate isomerase-like protein (cupin superfamily)
MATARVRWMVGIAVVGLHLAGGLAWAAERQVISGQTVVTGDQHQRDGDRVVYVVSGRGMATIDGEQVPFAPGTVLYIPNGKPYSIEAEGGDATLKMKGVKRKGATSPSR